MTNLSNKVALITGGGSGINLAFTKLLHGSGCKILIADLALHAQAQEWIASLPPDQSSRIHFHKTNVTDWAQLDAAFDACETTFNTKAPDIVVPGAGVYEPSSNTFWDDIDTDSRYKVLDVDLVHPIKTSRIAIRRLKEEKKPGTILLISSIAGQAPSLLAPLYSAAKHGINSFVWGMGPLGKELGIRVVGVAPGMVRTPLFTDSSKATKLLDLENDHLLDPEVIAQAMMALVTEDTYRAGTVLEVCDAEREKWRTVSMWNDSGPRGAAAVPSRRQEALDDFWAKMKL